MTTPTAPTTERAQVYVNAIAALNRQDWREALDLAQRLAHEVPEVAGVHYVAGMAALNLSDLRSAVGSLQQAVRLDGRRPDYLATLARALASAQMLPEAVEAADAAAALRPTDPQTLNTLAVVYSQANAYEKSARINKRAVDLHPNSAPFRFNLATSMTFHGDLDGAEVEYETCLRLQPSHWQSHLGLSQLRRQDPERNHLMRLHHELERIDGDRVGEMYLHLSLSKEYEDLGDLDRSFEHLSAGKAAGRGGRNYTAESDKVLFDTLMANVQPVRERSGGHPSEEPIFIIGMPRTGTTLVDRILSSHPDVHSAGELPNFGAVLKRASGSRTASLLDADTIVLARELDWRRVGEAYVASTRPGTGRTPRFIDKLPQNFLYAGHIARALPNARIICLRRNPMDTCLSNFRQLFQMGSSFYDYSFDLLGVGRYYLLFDRLMTHWQHVIPGRILEVHYESLVESQEATTRALLAHCGLDWDEACLRFEENEAPVATASAVQVRSPVYRSSLQRWKRYESHLTALKSLLEQAGIVVD
ncbi:tetratricopeptide repeat-containing sulfotransferase family protein [Lysobacter sp. Root494]|uniref:tetratricopeptide repeat-containing sulfotransferase family protein n=1 Tax=Lysobacter sp. Root494 TaxID=1736549 RepID=UPI0006FDB841|nr:tetratricopeptide repeat-containing sulfotransferase family protein [Lysobacter sp. Root494]KQY52074.1 sulfotransferase [Lysobacter sp. Root494]